MKKKKSKRKKPRLWLAVSAWFRTGAGAMKNKKKDIKKQRRWKQKKNME